MLARNVIPLVRRVVSFEVAVARPIASRLYHDDHHFKPPHMNEMPVPQGSWAEANRKRQTRNNLHLLLGVGFLAFSLTVAKQSGLFFLNFSAPEKPAE